MSMMETARWLTVKNRAAGAKETKNPWENGITAGDQLAGLTDEGGLPVFRRLFDTAEGDRVSIDATALGIFDLWCNGQRVGREENGRTVYDELKPGWTDYSKRVMMFTYDLTPYVKPGHNCIFAVVAPGWYHGRIALGTYGETEMAFRACLHIRNANGTEDIPTDGQWLTGWCGPVRTADIWDGEMYDATQPSFAQMSRVGFPGRWREAKTLIYHGEVSEFIGPTVQVREEFTRMPAETVIYEGVDKDETDFGAVHTVLTADNTDSATLKPGQTLIFDMAQNMVGWDSFTVEGAQDTVVKVRFAEMKNDSGDKSRGNDGPKGSVYTANYRSAKAKNYYRLKGVPGGETYHPTFTFYGFRYVEITASAPVEIRNFRALVVGTVNRETGHIETSCADVNKLISNIIWGQRGNYLSVPTDCPQRDERLGWTGDTQIFSTTAAYNADVDAFFHKWLQDARDSQSEAGAYSDVIPRSRVVGEGNAAWGDAGVIVPWNMYRMYGDISIIRECYASMNKYMDYLTAFGMEGPHPCYGDWLAYEPTANEYISITYYAIDALLMAKMSRVIGRADKAEQYDKLYADIRAAFRAKYCDENGELTMKTQTGYLLALRTGMLDEEKVMPAVDALCAKIKDNGYRLSTGFVGVGILNEVLSEFGHCNLAYSLLLQTENPSWLYSVHQGATTIWERWNSYTLATGFGDVGMNSFNHYSYGAVGEWMYRHMAGIEADEKTPGFRHFILQPTPDTRKEDEMPEGQEHIYSVKASFESPVGLIESAWSTENGFTYRCTVPVGATATLRLPVLTESPALTVNGEQVGFNEYTMENGRMVTELQAGNYTFIQV